MPGLDVLTAVTFMWNLFALIPYLISQLLPFLKMFFVDVYTLVLMEPFPYLLPMKPTSGWHGAADPAGGHTMDLPPWIPL